MHALRKLGDQRRSTASQRVGEHETQQTLRADMVGQVNPAEAGLQTIAPVPTQRSNCNRCQYRTDSPAHAERNGGEQERKRQQTQKHRRKWMCSCVD